MSDPQVIDLEALRRRCSQCSLQQLCLPAGVSAQDLDQLDSMVRRRKTVGAAERLFRAGDNFAAVYVAREGAFKTVCISSEGEEQIVGFHIPGEIIGLDAMGEGRHRCEAIALTKANVCEVPFAQLTEIAARVPGLQRQLLRVIGKDINRAHEHTSNLAARRGAHERLALFLHGLLQRYRLVNGKASSTFKLPMSREDIARYLGMANETVSRAFARLQTDRVIVIAGRRVDVLDEDLLTQAAHPVDEIDRATPRTAS
ncbi:helix-turn-helix domain-containing protein [Lysobacter soli]|jgi:CRP/FNR family transcriptional regulator|uniref:CRP-like protein Clp n=1 Tax=Lysobacter soli TaxID=453783 RepID=A0A3D8VE18_9GAMM|nr:helix-turn-helix domain-containing protein [Lysobacter soli]RDY67499.1 transcriptional regulator FNR [Lysobacter soli]